MSSQEIHHAARPALTLKTFKHVTYTIYSQYCFETVQLASIRQTSATDHGSIGELNPSRQERDGDCHSSTGHTPNCHQAIHSVWCSHSDLSHGRAIPYPTGKRHSGINPALQPDLFRHCSAALPARSSTPEHSTAGDANRLAPQHNQQGLPPTRN